MLQAKIRLRTAYCLLHPFTGDGHNVIVAGVACYDDTGYWYGCLIIFVSKLETCYRFKLRLTSKKRE